VNEWPAPTTRTRYPSAVARRTRSPTSDSDVGRSMRTGRLV